MMQIPEVNEVFKDRSRRERSLKLAKGLEQFFYGFPHENNAVDRGDIIRRLKKFEGVYHVISPNDAQDERPDVPDSSPTGEYCFYYAPPGNLFLITNEFYLDDSGRMPVYRNIKSGISFLSGDGGIYRFMVSRSDPDERVLWILERKPHEGIHYFDESDIEEEEEEDEEDEDEDENDAYEENGRLRSRAGLIEYVANCFLAGSKSISHTLQFGQGAWMYFELYYEKSPEVIGAVVKNQFTGNIWDIPL